MKFKKKLKFQIIFFIFIVFLAFLFLFQCSSPKSLSYRYFPSEERVYLPKDFLVPFSTYVEENRYRLHRVLESLFYQDNPFVGDFSVEEVLAMRLPEEHLPGQNCLHSQDKQRGYKTGFLFLHGLTDSPYSLKEVQNSLKVRFPCAVYRSTVMSGHATIPGDASTVSYQEWMKMVDYALHQFLGEVDELFLVGYSMGFTLAMEQIQSEGNMVEVRDAEYKIQGIIGLSPALRANDSFIWMAPYLKNFITYLEFFDDRNPVKYESFNLNLGGEFYRLSQKVDLDLFVDLPVFMAMSSDDNTVDPVKNYDYFCEKIKSPSKKMIWYQGTKNFFIPCEGMEVIPAKSEKFQMTNLSHVSIPFSARNRVYGFNQAYIDCLFYFKEKIKFEECKKNSNPYIYGEKNLLESPEILEGRFFRRSTFNPYFDQLMISMINFIEEVSAIILPKKSKVSNEEN